MTFATTGRVLYDGQRNLVIQYTGISDGSNETNVVKMRMSNHPPAKSAKITSVKGNISGGILQVLWSSTEPVPFLNLTDYVEIDYDSIGGLVNGGDDTANGDILFSTLGFDVGSSYNITLEMVKKFP